MVKTFNEIFRDFVTDGVPSSGNHEPVKADIREAMTQVEQYSGVAAPARVFQTLSEMNASLAYDVNTMAWVISDPTTANNGVYRKLGASGAGSWTRVADLPYSFVRANDVGTGTANAIQAATLVPYSANTLIILNIFETNTASPVTVSFNGDAALTIKTNTGNNIAPGGLVADMMVLGLVIGGVFRIVTDQVSTAIVAQVEVLVDEAEAARDAAITAASNLLYRVLPTVVDAEAATIDASTTYISIAEYSPVPRFFKRFATDPGSGTRFQSADGAWWQGLTMAPAALDFANAVARAGNVTITAADLDQVHLWTIPVSTTYTVTLPDPDTYIGRLVHLQVSAGSRGLLAFVCPDPIGKFVATELVIWGGESLTLLAIAGRWEIIGGVCKPLSLFATNPGANIAATWVASTGWITSQQGGEEWALNAGQIIVPRAGIYTSSFKVGVAWTTNPTFIYSIASNSGSGAAVHRNQYVPTAGVVNWILPSSRNQICAKGYPIIPVVIWSGGTGVVVERASFGAPELSLLEQPQW